MVVLAIGSFRLDVAYDISAPRSPPPLGKWRPDIHQIRLTGYALKHKMTRKIQPVT